MKEDKILKMGAILLKWIFTLFALVALIRGHNYPGGGFIGGLLIASGYIFYALAFGPLPTLEKLWLSPLQLIVTGLMVAILSGLSGFVFGSSLLEGIWFKLPLLGTIGTPLFFDAGVFLVVFGVALKIIFTVMIELKWK